jgi:hypothetical protein
VFRSGTLAKKYNQDIKTCSLVSDVLLWRGKNED